MSVADTISRPYAQAIFEIAIENNTIEEWKQILIFIKVLATYKKVRNFLSGSLSSEYLSSIFITIGGGLINKNAENLIKLLSEHQRFNISNNILEQFLKLEAFHKKIMLVELRSAFSLKERNISKVRKILERFFLRKIKFTCKVDPKILDGMIIKVNNTVFDLSTQNHLKQLSNALNF
ncbi:F0F1 ATP synthase subunit delta [Buchnera aphidicola (Sitobion avenae)]|uniref:ATP synthase subunit delta n=1 Tax=Buchnera aphidicola (Sitobion avenae) TaxID=571428 RepID=A0A4D6Y6T0_9GAMM|nr:F0F1 ATP synthase subunit delta [Buchnera aphidicola]QCI25247.1 F0F1 ATP synthase subunit delta [Buchnera aphidicola (Sitobion avenae)]